MTKNKVDWKVSCVTASKFIVCKMSTFDVNNVSPVRNAEGTFAVSNAMFHNASIVDEWVLFLI